MLRRGPITAAFQRLAAPSRPFSTSWTLPSPCVAARHSASFQQNHRRQQMRSMVVITKTSASDVETTGSVQAPADGTSMKASGTSADGLLEITPSCINQIHSLLKKRNKEPDEMFLRVFVDAGGCSGFTYQFELDDEFIPEEDETFEPPHSNGARVVVDQASLNLIRGSKIDYVQEMIKSAFVVADNPQSESACGCGSSFAIKNFASNPALD